MEKCPICRSTDINKYVYVTHNYVYRQDDTGEWYEWKHKGSDSNWEDREGEYNCRKCGNGWEIK